MSRDTIESLRARYVRQTSQLDVLIEHGKVLGRRFDGAIPENRAQREAVPIFLKQLCHAVSMRKLLPAVEGVEGELWDVGSVSALARCVIEAYDAMAYFALDAITDEERDFRERLSDLHDNERRTKMLGFIGSTNPEANLIRGKTLSLRKEVTHHPFFPKLSAENQRKILKGDAPLYYLSQKQRNDAGKIDHRQYQSSTVYLSQFVHSTPMAINQWRHFRAGGLNEVRSMMLSMQNALPYFAKGVQGIMTMFPSKGEVPQIVSEALEFWAGVAERGVAGGGKAPSATA